MRCVEARCEGVRQRARCVCGPARPFSAICRPRTPAATPRSLTIMSGRPPGYEFDCPLRERLYKAGIFVSRLILIIPRQPSSNIADACPSARPYACVMRHGSAGFDVGLKKRMPSCLAGIVDGAGTRSRKRGIGRCVWHHQLRARERECRSKSKLLCNILN